MTGTENTVDSEHSSGPGPVDDREAERALHIRRLIGDGAQLLAERRPGEAIPLLEAALRLDPRNVPAAINLGGAFILQGQFDLATPLLEAAAQLEPDNVGVWTNLAAAYLGKLPFAIAARQDRAIMAFERALALDEHAPNVHYNLGLVYLERSDTARALAHFARALEANPNDRDARNYLDKLQRDRRAKSACPDR